MGWDKDGNDVEMGMVLGWGLCRDGVCTKARMVPRWMWSCDGDDDGIGASLG